MNPRNRISEDSTNTYITDMLIRVKRLVLRKLAQDRTRGFPNALVGERKVSVQLRLHSVHVQML
jgi:hypothetical protein